MADLTIRNEKKVNGLEQQLSQVQQYTSKLRLDYHEAVRANQESLKRMQELERQMDRTVTQRSQSSVDVADLTRAITDAMRQGGSTEDRLIRKQ